MISPACMMAYGHARARPRRSRACPTASPPRPAWRPWSSACVAGAFVAVLGAGARCQRRASPSSRVQRPSRRCWPSSAGGLSDAGRDQRDARRPLPAPADQVDGRAPRDPMTLRLRNTLTRQVEPVEPLEPRRPAAHASGSTPAARPSTAGRTSATCARFLLADLIRRALLYHGLDVFHVKNITDVGHLRDERFDRGAGPDAGRGTARGQVARPRSPTPTRPAFHADEALVNILPAHVFPRATEHIPEMLALAEALEDLGYAYLAPDGHALLRGRPLRRLRAPVGQHARRAARRPPRARSRPASAMRPTSRSGRRPARVAS